MSVSKKLATTIETRTADEVACHDIRIRLREDAESKTFKLDSLIYEVMVGAFNVSGNFEALTENDLMAKVPAITGSQYKGRKRKVPAEQLPVAIRTALEGTLADWCERNWIKFQNLQEKAG